MTVPTPEQLLSGGATAVKFKAYGDAAEGVIVRQEVRQATDPATGRPDFYPSGDPKWQILYTLQTTLRDDVDDDGRRTLYAKGNMLGALRQAREAIGADKIEDGGWIRMIYTGEGEAKKGLNPPKLFSAEYRRPSDVQLDQQAPQQAQAQPQFQQSHAPQQPQPQYQQNIAQPQYAPQAPPAPQYAPQQAAPRPQQGPPANSNIPSQEAIQALLNIDPSGELLKKTYPGFGG